MQATYKSELKHKLCISLICLIPVVILTIIGLLWISLLLIFIYLIFISFFSKVGFADRLRDHKVLRFLLSVILVFILAIYTRVFLFEIYVIPTGSMENTLIPGDRVIVSKLSYGPLLPSSLYDVPWLKIFVSNHKNDNQSGLEAKKKRLKGYSKIYRGDIVLFRNPRGGSLPYLIKRCVGLSGDTIQIINAHVYINNKKQPDPVESKFLYSIWFHDQQNLIRLAKNMKIPNFELKFEKRAQNVLLALTSEQVNYMRLSKIVDSVTIVETNTADTVRRRNDQFEYSRADLMPSIINSDSSLSHNEVNMNSDAQYFFMIGDNRFYSEDSRAFGYIRKDDIIGKVSIILFSVNKGAFQPGRFFKKAR